MEEFFQPKKYILVIFNLIMFIQSRGPTWLVQDKSEILLNLEKTKHISVQIYPGETKAISYEVQGNLRPSTGTPELENENNLQQNNQHSKLHTSTSCFIIAGTGGRQT